MKELLFSVTKENCEYDYYRGSGKGGQKRNKTSNCVRCTHPESGAVATSEEGRSQSRNKVSAFSKMILTSEFKLWHKLETAKRSGRLDDVEQIVNESMRESNLRVEEKVNGKWRIMNETV